MTQQTQSPMPIPPGPPAKSVQAVKPKRGFRPLANAHVQGVLVLLMLLGVTGIYIFSNRQPAHEIAPPMRVTETQVAAAYWQQHLQENLANLPSATPSPSPTPEATQYTPPTLPPAEIGIAVTPEIRPVTPAPLLAGEAVVGNPTPAFVNATPLPLPTGVILEVLNVPEENPQQFQLPPEQVPLGMQPNDHFWLSRPVDSSGNSRALFNYPYGSGYQQGWRIHHGLDLPNPTGTRVQAAAAGRVVFAGQNEGLYRADPNSDLEIYSSYGNFVVIEHDFSWRGQPIWTLYAHLSAILVAEGDYVEMGDPIGLVGTTGQVTGPHVHFEVRVGRNSYSSTRNPLLWMAPYTDHGVVAGQILDAEGRFVDSVVVQLTRNGRIVDTTTSYINPYEEGKRVWAVVPSESWGENFVLGDIPAGEYQMTILVNNQRFPETVTVRPGVTTFVSLQLDLAATPQPLPSPVPVDGSPSPPATALPSPTAQP